MMLDRELQKRILETMREAYPGIADGAALIDLLPEGRSDRAQRGQIIATNLAYLHEHGLVEAPIEFPRGRPTFGRSKITAKGLDFLADDGGLSAILGVVTIRLHADTMRELLISRVQSETSLPPAEKAGLLEAIKHLPETSLREAAKYLVRVGLERLPDAINWLRTMTGR